MYITRAFQKEPPVWGELPHRRPAPRTFGSPGALSSITTGDASIRSALPAARGDDGPPLGAAAVSTAAAAIREVEDGAAPLPPVVGRLRLLLFGVLLQGLWLTLGLLVRSAALATPRPLVDA